MENGAMDLAKEIYLKAVKEFNFTYTPGPIGQRGERPMIRKIWTYPLDKEILDTLHIAAGDQYPPHGRFVYEKQIVVYNVTNDGKFIRFTLHSFNPIQTMNQVLDLAANEMRRRPGMKLTARMLDQLSVISVTLADYSLVLIPTAPHLRPSILKRKSKILFAIKSLFPDVSGITIISDIRELMTWDK